MNRTVSLVECGPFLADGQQPVVLYKRERDDKTRNKMFSAAEAGFGDVWFVNSRSMKDPDGNVYKTEAVEQMPIDIDELSNVELAKVRYEEMVRIPLFRYFTNARDLRLISGFAAQIGVVGALSLPKVRRVLELHLAIGDVFDRQEEGRLEFYLGFAFRCLPL